MLVSNLELILEEIKIRLLFLNFVYHKSFLILNKN